MAVAVKFAFLPRNSKYWPIYLALGALFVVTLVASFLPFGESWAPGGLAVIPLLALVVRIIEAARARPPDVK
jgi:hypothetical protein